MKRLGCKYTYRLFIFWYWKRGKINIWHCKARNVRNTWEHNRQNLIKYDTGRQRTVGWSEKVEERVVMDRLGDRALGASSFVLLRLLYHFHRHVLAFFPVYCAPVGMNNKSVNNFTAKNKLMANLNSYASRCFPEELHREFSSLPFTFDYFWPLKRKWFGFIWLATHRILLR